MFMTVREIAQVVYEANRGYCQSLGDNSFLPWSQAEEWQKSTIVDGIHFHMANPDATPQSSHQNWLKTKYEDGWVYGPVKDPSKKTHPCIKPYDELPKEQQAKDYIFTAIVRTLLSF